MTPSKEILEYYDATSHRETRDDLRLAVKLVDDTVVDKNSADRNRDNESRVDNSRIAIDCGCGAGSDIAFLRSKGFIVHAFDIEQESITRCQKRFGDDKDVLLSQATFTTFEYPRASLIVADASLYFCPEDEFHLAWCRITASLLPGGIFVGSFLGPEDTMASPNNSNETLWSEVRVSTPKQVEEILNGFETINFTEYRTTDESMGGETHDWHIFSVIARKEAMQGAEH
ncbi:MAG: class I SAM-dependent methyltransferase [Pseudomonadales bacterium]|nr:class I SAM-dependent methyltransferase [Pseudomonadales bacterium]